MLKQAPNIKYNGERCVEAQLSVSFIVNKEDFASVVEGNNIVESAYEAAFRRASGIAQMIHKGCETGLNAENLPFIRRLFEESDPENYYVPYVLTEFEGADEAEGEGDASPVFSITLANPEGGAFEVEQMKAFRDFVRSIADKIVSEHECTIEYAGLSEYRRYSISAVEQISLDD